MSELEFMWSTNRVRNAGVEGSNPFISTTESFYDNIRLD